MFNLLSLGFLGVFLLYFVMCNSIFNVTDALDSLILLIIYDSAILPGFFSKSQEYKIAFIKLETNSQVHNF